MNDCHLLLQLYQLLSSQMGACLFNKKASYDGHARLLSSNSLERNREDFTIVSFHSSSKLTKSHSATVFFDTEGFINCLDEVPELWMPSARHRVFATTACTSYCSLNRS